MNMMSHIVPPGALGLVLIILNTLASSVVLWTALCTLNFMGTQTSMLARAIYVMIGTGAGAMLIGPFYWHHKPGVGAVTLLVGVAALLVSERFYTRKLAHRYSAKLGQTNRRWYS